MGQLGLGLVLVLQLGLGLTLGLQLGIGIGFRHNRVTIAGHLHLRLGVTIASALNIIYITQIDTQFYFSSLNGTLPVYWVLFFTE